MPSPKPLSISISSASRCSRWTGRMSSRTPPARSTTVCAIRNGGSACRRTRPLVSDRIWILRMWELTKSFRFEAAHALPGTTLGAASEEIHGHSFRAEVTVRGTPDPATGMVLDLGLLERSMTEVRKMLDHKLLNKVDALGPPTLENLSRFIWDRVQRAGPITRVSVHRDSCNESCAYYGPQG